MNDIEFDEGAAIKALKQARLYPHGTRVAALQAAKWWLDLLERVTDAVNEHDWHEEQYPSERAEEFVSLAVEQAVADARKEGQVMTLLTLSDVDNVLDDPRTGEVYTNLTKPLLDDAPGAELYRHSGEEADEYDERREQARKEHREEALDKLRLGSVTQIYLSAAATLVAEPWAQAQIEAWEAANPEDDEEEE